MSTYADPRPHAGGERDRPRAPAYGPVDAVLGYVLFYVVVDHATPTVVETLTGVLPGVSPSAVGFGLASVLWFVLVVTVVDQLRRQLAALGVGHHDPGPLASLSRSVPTETRALAYLVALLAGATVATVTVAPALDAVVSLVPVVATLDVGAFAADEFLVMVVFFLSYSVATHALDRLVVGGVREALSE